MSTQTKQDIKSDSALLNIFPEWARPYAVLARVDRPVGIWLLLLPALWAIIGAGKGHGFDFSVLVLFAIGAVIMRSAGCVINDLWDRKLDAKVERTATRPLVAGDVSTRNAVLFLCGLLALGLLILLQFNIITILIGLLSVPLILVYPLMKRLTWWPQAFLGLVFNFGALMGWSAVAGIIELPALFLYAAGLFWTMAYDTIYAHQDLEDDIAIGVKSTARLFGERSKIYVRNFYALSFGLSCLAIGGYSFILLVPAGLYAARLLKSWDQDDPHSCLRSFQRSQIYGFLVLAGFLLAAI